MKNHRLLALWLVAFAIITASAPGVRAADTATAERMTKAAQAFIQSLNDEQRSQATMAFDAPGRTDWHYIPKAERKGLTLGQMTEPQREAALALLEASLSKEGYDKARTIMSLEEILRKVEGNAERRDPLKYYWTIFGTPGKDARWGLSVEGHHLSLNFVVAGGTIVPTPMFFGANPNIVKKDYNVGPPKGTYPLGDEEQWAFDLLNSFDDAQRKQAIVAEKAANDMAEAPKAQTEIGAPEGLPVAKMKPQQKELVGKLLGAYIRKAPADVAKPYLEQAMGQLDQAHFAWYGATKEGAPHAYRIQGPEFLILLYNTQADTDKNPANHSHTVWRTIGKDFYLSQR